jgi:FkbM family methyltransferase
MAVKSGALIRTLLRDNEIANPFFRNIIRRLYRINKLFRRVTSLYRVYGIVSLKVDGVKFKIYAQSDDHIANNIFYGQNYEDDEFRLLKRLTQRSQYFIDIGANTGIFSIYAASANPKLNVLCFEPHPSNFDRLAKNISINSTTNVNAFSNAVGATKRDIEFVIPADLGISATASANEVFASNFHPIDYKRISVKQISIDETLRDLPLTFLDVIKIDVEYYELEVLKGAKATLQNKRPSVIIEILQYEYLVEQFPKMKNKISENHAIEIFSFFTAIGYHCYSIERGVLNSIKTLQGANRNFLFVSAQLSGSQYSFDEISTALRAE